MERGENFFPFFVSTKGGLLKIPPNHNKGCPIRIKKTPATNLGVIFSLSECLNKKGAKIRVNNEDVCASVITIAT